MSNTVLITEAQKCYLRRLEEHLSFINNDFVCAGLRCSEENDVLILEGFEWFGFTPFVHRDVFSTDPQPQIMREAALLTLQTEK